MIISFHITNRKCKAERIKLFPSNLIISQNKAQENIDRNTELSNTSKGKIHLCWHLVKITKPAKDRKNMTYNEEKKHSIKTDLEFIQALEIADKDNQLL